MSERKIQTKSIPLRLRISPTNGFAQPGREQFEFSSTVPTPGSSNLQPSALPDRRTHQVRELLRLCDILRADLSLEEVLQQIVSSIVSCTGFRVLTVNLIEHTGKMMVPVAFAGMSLEDQRLLREHPFSIEKFFNFMRPEFRISQSYFIPHEYFPDLRHSLQHVVFPNIDVSQHEPGRWHREDALIVPLYSPREQKLLGFLSPDDPEDGQVPTLESIEIVELFANKASIAIDNARIYQEREAERIALEEGIAVMCNDLEQMQKGDLRIQIRSTHPKLQPAAAAINTMVDQISALLRDMQEVAHVVDDHLQNVQHNSTSLVQDTLQQETQVRLISETVGSFAQMMDSISETAANLSRTGVDAVEVTNEAQSIVDRAFEGMSSVRETTMQSARTMKTLGESGQEINMTISTMSDLTMRMHLLALNAAIEATRAGDAGESFSVIAQEIRSLATQSTEAAKKVEAYIRIIQEETGAVSQSVELSTQQVIMQTELVTQTGVALEAISIVTEQLTPLIEGICTTADNQKLVSKQVINSVDDILRMTDGVTAHMQEMQHSTARLVELTNSLRIRMSRMRMR